MLVTFFLSGADFASKYVDDVDGVAEGAPDMVDGLIACRLR